MHPTETEIRDTLISFINHLVELALRTLGLWGAGRPMHPIQITVIWQIEVWFEVQLPRVVKQTQLGPEAEATLRTALGQLHDRLEQVVADGGTALDVRQAAVAFRDQWTGWARKVATTESTRMAAEAVLASPAAQQPGAQKQWLTSHDEKVRRSHKLADGDTVPVAGSFIVGGTPLRYPGDPFGDPEEIINCRCGIKIVRKGARP